MYNIKSVSLKHNIWYKDNGFINVLEVGETLIDNEIVSIELNNFNDLPEFLVNFDDDVTVIIPYHNVSGYEVGEM